jgi:tetratricopeptide (TPR) repeat protein
VLRLIGYFLLVFVALSLLRQLPFVGAVFDIPFVGFYLAAIVVSLVSARMGSKLVDKRRLRRSISALGEVDTPHNAGKLGALLAGQGKHREALPHLEKAWAYDGEVAEWAYRVGRSKLSLGEIEGASEALAKAVLVDEEHGYGEALRRLAEALTLGGAPDEALSRLDRHDVIYGETPESAYLRGRAHQGRGDREAAKAAFARAPGLVEDVVKYQRAGARAWAMRARLAGWLC